MIILNVFTEAPPVHSVPTVLARAGHCERAKAVVVVRPVPVDHLWRQIIMMMMAMMMMMVTQHIPTMTDSHHGGFLSVMIMVGICQVTKSHHK